MGFGFGIGRVLLVAAVAAALGVGWLSQPANRFHVLKIPKVGFVLHAMLGGDLPGYITTEAFRPGNENRVFTPGSVLVCAGAKSGTTWTMNVSIAAVGLVSRWGGRVQRQLAKTKNPTP